MTITKRIILSDEEQELFEKVYNILTSVCNEVEGKEKIAIEELKLNLNEFCYEYGSNYYREYH